MTHADDPARTAGPVPAVTTAPVLSDEPGASVGPVRAPAGIVNGTTAEANSAKRIVRWYWEDFAAGQVREFGAMPVTREAVLAFATQFDPQPFHLDDAAAEAGMFGRLAASGWHTCAMAMRMMCDGYLLDSASLGSPGLDNIRWLKPVFPGDTLSLRLTTLETRPMASRPKVGLAQSKWEVLNQDREVVLTMQGWGMFGRREPAAVVD